MWLGGMGMVSVPDLEKEGGFQGWASTLPRLKLAHRTKNMRQNGTDLQMTNPAQKRARNKILRILNMK